MPLGGRLQTNVRLLSTCPFRRRPQHVQTEPQLTAPPGDDTVPRLLHRGQRGPRSQLQLRRARAEPERGQGIRRVSAAISAARSVGEYVSCVGRRTRRVSVTVQRRAHLKYRGNRRAFYNRFLLCCYHLWKSHTAIYKLRQLHVSSLYCVSTHPVYFGISDRLTSG